MNHQHNHWQAVFFDFDGVIAASLAVKIRAFATLFAPYGPAVQAAVVQYHRDNGGMPRHRKLRHCCEVLAGRPVDDRELADLGHTFADLVRAEVVAAPLIAGALETLEQLRRAGIPAFVVSGTPHEEMGLIVADKGLQSYFAEVHGSPRSKTEIISQLLDRYHYDPGHCLFIGDALTDYHAARATGLHFLGIVPEGTASIFPAGVPTLSRVHLTCSPGCTNTPVP